MKNSVKKNPIKFGGFCIIKMYLIQIEQSTSTPKYC